jgi:hypothetical protein
MSRLSVVESQFSWPLGDFTEKQRSHQMEGITGVSESPSQSDWGVGKENNKRLLWKSGHYYVFEFLQSQAATHSGFGMAPTKITGKSQSLY